MEHKTNLLMCPSCKTYMCMASNVGYGEDAEPRAGDFSICANCADILCFEITHEGTSYRKATSEDIGRAEKDEIYGTLLAAQMYILSGRHSFRNMTKEEIDSMSQKDNW